MFLHLAFFPSFLYYKDYRAVLRLQNHFWRNTDVPEAFTDTEFLHYRAY